MVPAARKSTTEFRSIAARRAAMALPRYQTAFPSTVPQQTRSFGSPTFTNQIQQKATSYLGSRIAPQQALFPRRQFGSTPTEENITNTTQTQEEMKREESIKELYLLYPKEMAELNFDTLNLNKFRDPAWTQDDILRDRVQYSLGKMFFNYFLPDYNEQTWKDFKQKYNIKTDDDLYKILTSRTPTPLTEPLDTMLTKNKETLTSIIEALTTIKLHQFTKIVGGRTPDHQGNAEFFTALFVNSTVLNRMDKVMFYGILTYLHDNPPPAGELGILERTKRYLREKFDYFLGRSKN
jgi:hypothetical protein